MAILSTCTDSAADQMPSATAHLGSSPISVNKRTVVVRQLPNQLTPSKVDNFFSDLQVYGETQRPRFVLDCSNVWVMDGVTINLLLCCLEEVMKSNGDVRLASLHPEAEAVLQFAGVKRLFEVYASVDGAVNSFHQRTSSIAMLPFAESFDDNVERAA